jgi:glycine/D-amino acid oxidase-like deaminating enzyme
MLERNEVVVVGAGIVGSSIAYQLGALGQRGVCVVEKEGLPATGSTAKANGGIRAQFTTAINAAMSLASMEILDDLAGEIGEPPLYRKAGYLFVTGARERFETMAAAAEVQRSLGVAVELLDERRVRALAPYVAGDVAGGTYGARDGFLDPGGLANFFLAGARRQGATVRFDCEVRGIERHGTGDFTLHTDAGEMGAAVVVNAAGPHAASIAAMLGVDVPVVPVRRHIVVSGPCPSLPRQIPMTVDADTGVLIRREGDRVVIAYSNPDEPPGFDMSFDPCFVERIVDPVERRFPAVAAAGVDLRKSWAGLYEVTPDHHAILGEAPSAPGFFLANGFSGHGVMHAPAAGRCVAELIVGGRSATVDIAPLALERFARGAAIHETMVL